MACSPAASTTSCKLCDADALTTAEAAEDDMESAIELPDDRMPTDGPSVAEAANEPADLVAERTPSDTAEATDSSEPVLVPATTEEALEAASSIAAVA